MSWSDSGGPSDDLYEGTFEHSGSGRDIDIWLERDFHHIGLSYLVLSVSDSQIYSGIDIAEGGRAMIRDIETLKHHLAKVQRVINDRLRRLADRLGDIDGKEGKS